MILIISSLDDRSTNDVIDWLRYYQAEFIRISDKDNIQLKGIQIGKLNSGFDLVINGQNYNSRDFDSVWYRRSEFKSEFTKVDLSNLDDQTQYQIFEQLKSEYDVWNQYLIENLKINHINSELDNRVNKLSVLRIAGDLGMNIPDTLVTGSKLELRKFIESHKRVITKNLSQGMFVRSESHSLISYTSLVTDEWLKKLPIEFFPMLFQQCINKVFELRIFFLKGMFYASAIMSQEDKQTQIDFRNYNYDSPNRTPPYRLPGHIQVSLKELMNRLNMNSGSIDMMVNEKGEYFFLEVNPVGQFAQVSHPCNYYIEKKIAEELIN